uniref:Uncharacterized protein n=1 Tax=Arundo donax TaxID=35708 RepID=A0A0A9CVS5_ARUDO
MRTNFQTGLVLPNSVWLWLHNPTATPVLVDRFQSPEVSQLVANSPTFPRLLPSLGDQSVCGRAEEMKKGENMMLYCTTCSAEVGNRRSSVYLGGWRGSSWSWGVAVAKGA